MTLLQEKTGEMVVYSSTGQITSNNHHQQLVVMTLLQDKIGQVVFYEFIHWAGNSNTRQGCVTSLHVPHTKCIKRSHNWELDLVGYK